MIENGYIYEDGVLLSILGKRKVVLNDLSPFATFIANNYNTLASLPNFDKDANRIILEVEKECGWMYETWHPSCEDSRRIKAKINFVIWSDIFTCPECGTEMVFWDVAVDTVNGKVNNKWNCPQCQILLSKSLTKDSSAIPVEKTIETLHDRELGYTINRVKQVPVVINYSIGKKRHEKKPDAFDIELITDISERIIPYNYPTQPMMFKGQGWGDTWRAGVHYGLTHAHHFYTRRNIWVLAAIWTRVRKGNISPLCNFLFTSTLPWTTRQNRLLMSNYFFKTGGVIAPNLPGTLYVSSIGIETNPLERFRLRTKSARFTANGSEYVITCQSSTAFSNLQDKSFDYIFVDPPFGGNLMYSELNFLSEAWARVFTNTSLEAIINNSQGKNIREYLQLMENCFYECYRILKPGHWMTVEFHNSQNTVWNSIQQAILQAGFIIADVRILEKTHKTFKQVNSANAVKKDLAITAYRPNGKLEEQFRLKAGTEEGVWEFVRYHLGKLPSINLIANKLIVNAEREAFLLFDRMVAFHIQRGVMVPISAPEFYAGLEQRFTRRDGMYFLPDQVAEYDNALLNSNGVVQLQMLVTDEKSAIAWLRQELDASTNGKPQTQADLNPKFKMVLHQAKHEQSPELVDILEQNFLQDETGKWYVPDPNRASDLEKVRQRALLREFKEYTEGRGRLRQFRSEAVRAGFLDALRRQDYDTIFKVAERLPENVLREDPDLLMYYDSAMLRKM